MSARARFSTDEVAALADTFREPLTAPEWARVEDEVGPVAELASELYGRGLLVGPVLARAVPAAWSLSASPLRMLGHQRWRELFAAAGFTIDGVSAPLPPRPVVLYRGASHLRRRGWSWTPDLSIAARFALRHGFDGGAARIYSAQVPPVAMLAAMSPDLGMWPGESEVVVDTAGLTIRLEERNAFRPQAGIQ